MNCIFDEEIQKNWRPNIGDIIVGCTGNIFVISGYHIFSKELGGTMYFFGTHPCGKNGSGIMKSNISYAMNISGKTSIDIDYDLSKIEEYKFVPYSHENKTKDWIFIDDENNIYPNEGEEVLISDGINYDIAYFIKSAGYKFYKMNIKEGISILFDSFIPIKFKYIN